MLEQVMRRQSTLLESRASTLSGLCRDPAPTVLIRGHTAPMAEPKSRDPRDQGVL